jgi:hypothetical protein
LVSVWRITNRGPDWYAAHVDVEGNAMANDILPEGFAALAPFHPYRGVSTTEERRARRDAAPMEDIQRFYVAMLEHAPAAIAHLKQFTLDTVPATSARLMELLLALMHVSMAIELHGQPPNGNAGKLTWEPER